MISVSVIEDHPVFRHGLAMFVENAAGLRLVGAHPSVEAYDDDRSESPRVIVLETRVLVVSGATTRDDVLAAIGAGASGSLGKDSDPDEIVKAIEVVDGGGTYVSATLASFLLDAVRRHENVADAFELTPKEHEVLSLLARGERGNSSAVSQALDAVSSTSREADHISNSYGLDVCGEAN